MVTIVTDRLYLLTEKIHSIYVDEEMDHFQSSSGKRSYVPQFKIVINFVPIDANNSNNIRNDNSATVEIRGFGRKRTVLLFKDIVRQIREQCPDQLYLDKVIDNFLSQEVEDDAGTKEIRRLGEEERRSKKVLRRSKRGNITGSKRSRSKRLFSGR